MYGQIGKIGSIDGKRQDLIEILLNGSSNMPGCLSYIISKNQADKNALWITEVWDKQESHSASLFLESVQEAIEKGKPLIAGFGERYKTEPIGGFGLK